MRNSPVVQNGNWIGELATYDDEGNIIPLPEKFRTDGTATQENENPTVRTDGGMFSTNNIDNYSEKEYDEKRGEVNGRENGFRRLQEASRRIAGNGPTLYNTGEKQIDEGLRRHISGLLRSKIVADGYVVRNGNGFLRLSAKENIYIMHIEVNGKLFHDCLEIARCYLYNGELVDLHDVKTTEKGIGYEDCFNYLSEDGLSGFSITLDGDLISVFNVSGKSGFLRAISEVVKEKARTLDCYMSQKQPLNEMYEKIFGFKTVSVMDYNMKYDHDNIAKNHGNPTVAFMVNTEEKVEERHFEENEYDEALCIETVF